MDPSEALRRFASARSAVLATTTAAGRSRLVPICHALVDRRIFFAIDDVKAKTTTELARLRDIAGNPAVSLLAQHYEEDWTKLWWVRIYGQAQQLAPDSTHAREGLAALVAKYPGYAAHPPPGPVVGILIEAVHGWAAQRPRPA